MNISAILKEILKRYPHEYARDNKVSSPYYKDLKQRVAQTFVPLLEEFNLSIHALGGQGVMRKIPYITFLAEGHQTNKGIYPNYHFDPEHQRVFVGIGDADDNPPPDSLARQIAARAAELLSDFQAKNEDGYPRKVYSKDELDEATLRDDLKMVFEAYQSCLEEFAEEVQAYLRPASHSQDEGTQEIIWAIQAGESGHFWEEWQEQECISIGWSELGDPTSFKSVSDVQQALLAAYPNKVNPKFPHMACINDAHTVNYFVNKMRAGDLVAAIKGRHTILGIGEIVSDYRYANPSPLSDYDHQNIRKVRWLKTTPFETDHGLPIKTVTPLYPEYVNYQRIKQTLSQASFTLNSEDIDALIKSFLTWYEHDVHKNNECIEEYQKFSEAYFTELSDEDLIEVMYRFAYDGGKIQGGGYRTAKLFRESMQNHIHEFRQFILTIFAENFDVEQWWNQADLFRGFGKGIRSIFLHRVFPNRFTVFNNKSQEAYQQLGLLPEKKPYGAFKYGLINEAAQKLIAYRPDVLNFYRADAMTHFLLGIPEGQQTLLNIQNRGDYKNIGYTDVKIFREGEDEITIDIDEQNLPPVIEYHDAYPLEQCVKETGFALSTLQTWVRAIRRKQQVIFYGPPGTGKTFIAEQLAKHLIGGGKGFTDLVQFHPAYAYEDFIQGIRPKTRDDGTLTYLTVPGRFLEFCEKARACAPDVCVLIIDEINRANLSRVFGELMYLLEYRTQEAHLASGDTLRIPENVYIIGTMNTADRSIALVDYALRRRFAFLALRPDYEVLRHYHEQKQAGFAVDSLIEILKQLNLQINDQHYEVGISFFLRHNLAEELQDIWQMEIEPYLEEYFFDQAAKVEKFRWAEIQEKVLA